MVCSDKSRTCKCIIRLLRCCTCQKTEMSRYENLTGRQTNAKTVLVTLSTHCACANCFVLVAYQSYELTLTDAFRSLNSLIKTLLLAWILAFSRKRLSSLVSYPPLWEFTFFVWSCRLVQKSHNKPVSLINPNLFLFKYRDGSYKTGKRIAIKLKL